MHVTKVADLRARLEAARAALLAARFDVTLDMLDECEDWPLEIAEWAVLVKADTITRRDGAAALGYLASTDDVASSDAARFHRELLTGRAFGNVRNFNAAAARFERARALLERVPDGGPKLAYQSARLRWFKREAKPDDADVALALTDPDPSGRAAAYSVRAWTHASQGDYRAQIADLSTALEIAAATRYRCDVGAIGMIVHTLARVAFETAHASGIATARAAFEGLAWTDDVRVDQFQTLRALGLDSFMRGDAARSQWLFRDAASTAPSPAFRALAHLDRAYVARIMRNEAWALDEIAEAARIAQGVAWGDTYGEERVALVMLAVLLAPVDAGAARRFAATYSMLGVESTSPTLALSREPRAVAAEQYAFGRIEQTLGNADLAETSLFDAYAVYAPIEHHFAAMQIAGAMFELTGDAAWAKRMRGHAEAYPGCPLLVTFSDVAVPADGVLDALPPLQRQLARAHWAGATPAELSQRFSRSLYTIERQIAEIYRAFGVQSQPGLRAEALRRNLV